MSCGPRIAALIKQVPAFEHMSLGRDGRLVREGVDLEMNPYCRRAVATARDLAAEAGGESIAITLGPPAAEDVVREAIACGVDRAVLLTDPACAGSDTLATARAMHRVLAHLGGVDLVIVGKNSVDADTGQVGPELAELLDWPFAGPARELDLAFNDETFTARCETDDGFRVITGSVPAVLACAERLCEPAKAPPPERAAVDPDRITILTTLDLGHGTWGCDASPTRVGATRIVEVGRSPRVLSGSVDRQVASALEVLRARRALGRTGAAPTGPGLRAPPPSAASPSTASPSAGAGPSGNADVWAVVEPSLVRIVGELAQAAVRLAAEAGGRAQVVCLGGHPGPLPTGVAGMRVLEAPKTAADEDYAACLARLVDEVRPWGILFPSTTRGREIASRVAAALGLGLTGDAVDLEVADGRLVAWKPAFGGRLVAAITSTSDVQMATVRPGVLPASTGESAELAAGTLVVEPRGRVRVVETCVLDDVEALATAPAVVVVGTGVDPRDYERLEPLRRFLQAELGATRKVTDNGWLPRSRQVGITGRAVSPRLLLSIGASGKFNHSVGFRAAGTVLAINRDKEAPIFEHCDVGIVARWQDAVPLLEARLSEVFG